MAQVKPYVQNQKLTFKKITKLEDLEWWKYDGSSCL
jgi:hypothetical protein